MNWGAFALATLITAALVFYLTVSFGGHVARGGGEVVLRAAMAVGIVIALLTSWLLAFGVIA